MKRGALYKNVQDELFSYIERLIGFDPASIGHEDANALIGHFSEWFAELALARRVFIPCVISRTSAPRFEIGPVTFEFIDRLATSNFRPPAERGGKMDHYGFDELLKWMRDESADWLARVSVDHCEQKRAEEIGELAVDLAIVGLQLAAPYLGTRNMARLDARRGTPQKRTLSEVNGCYGAGWTRKDPGMSIGAGTLADILQKGRIIFDAVGNVVHSFAGGSFRLPNLEQAWCDAAYWLHQALAESIDTIAIAKLETSLEVLLCTQDSKGSNQRLLNILKVFFDLDPDEPVAPGSLLTARQFARNVVSERSRILHGTWSTLNTPGIDREGMEVFVISVLRRAVIELEAYVQSGNTDDSVDAFISWLSENKIARPSFTHTQPNAH